SVRSRVADAIDKFPLKSLLSVSLNNISIFESKGLIEFLSKTLLTLEPKGLFIHSTKRELLQFIGNHESEKYETAKKIFNAFYEFNANHNMPITFFESACNYKKPFDIKGVELIQDIIPTNEYLEQSSRSLVDSQYRLSALNWAISIVRKDETV